MHSRQGLAALDEGCPFDISSNGQLFNQRRAGRSSKHPAGRTTMLPIICTRIERGKGFRWPSPWGSHSYVTTTTLRPRKGGRKRSISCGSLGHSSVGQPEKCIYSSTLLSNEEKEQVRRIFLGNANVFALIHSDMAGIDPMLASHKLNIISTAKPIRHKIRCFHLDHHQVIQTEVDNLLSVGFIREVKYPE